MDNANWLVKLLATLSLLLQNIDVTLSSPLRPQLLDGRDIVYDNSTAYSDGELGVSPTQRFRSSNLQPPAINLVVSPSSPDLLQEGYIFLTISSRSGNVQSGPAIYDNNGSLIWFEPSTETTTMLRPHIYQGEKILSFFEGSFYSAGYGNGTNYLFNDRYERTGNVTMHNQPENTGDFHEFQITANNTALVESYVLAEADLSVVNGPANGYVLDCVVQEIDIASNTLLFDWHALDHIPISESYFEINNDGNSSGNPFDWCHVNSIAKDQLGNYIVSMRGPSTVYNISSSGEINWRLAGKASNFTMGPNATFYYQHDARLHDNDTRLTVFDNGGVDGAPAEPYARGLELALDMNNMTATLVQEWPAPFNNISGSQGSFQLLPNGNFLVGWGIQPYFSEFAASGDILLHAQFSTEEPGFSFSYRAWKDTWYGNPTTQPNISVETTSGSNALSVYCSWNGATNVSSWSLLGGSTAQAVTAVLASTPRTGFESVVNATAQNIDFVSVAALDVSGACLGTSQVWDVSTNTPTAQNGTCPSA